MQAQSGEIEVTADQAVKISSVQQDVTLAAAKNITMASGGGYIQMGGAYSWTLNLPAQSINRLQLTYRALPQFGLEDISDESFANHVMQYCGNPDEIRKKLKAYSPDISYVLVERYVLPIKFKKTSDQ